MDFPSLLRPAFGVLAFALALLRTPTLEATTLDRMQATCAACGRASEQTVIGSTNTMGAPDLDLRPAEMQRSTMEFWVHECPHCGYCSGNLAEAQPDAAAATRSEAYRAQLKNPNFPPLANRFLCQMLLADQAGDHKAAVHAAKCAAWACDDAGKTEQALQARTAALERLAQLKAKGESLYDQPGADENFLSDFARRCGHFLVAAAHARHGLELKPESIIAQVLDYELALAERQDADCHTVGELPRPDEASAAP